MKIYPDDWRNRLTSAVAVAVCMAATMMLGPLVGIDGFWPVMLAMIVGLVLGGLVGRLLFPPSPGGPSDQPPRA
jgi:hypothetical protein